ncbi:hypothetical protein [Paenibacillus cremeus]|uniref:Uncharacterized protein n=1 Tax=Paenibacillus cremeus TaxID=2163881 RepID=A0A559K4V1_9BACL|nr:hypothetical protein [Paenibacillus cremeus]TVY07127.1 hypothetical protein FPZ49_25395 [Paenibacillus cremeus]
MKKALIVFTAGVLLFCGILGSRSYAASSEKRQLPTTIVLTESVTTVYDGIGGSEIFGLAPQSVEVVDAESGWASKLYTDSNSFIWFNIKTYTGNKWIRIRNPQFNENYYDAMFLTGEEKLYSGKSVGSRSDGTISPQSLQVLFADDGYYLVSTWLGYKWIHPVHRVIDHLKTKITNINSSIRLKTKTPIFELPDAGSEVVGWLSPQDVQFHQSFNYEWFYIDTWMGPRWVNLQIGYPMDIKQIENKLVLTDQIAIYEHPNIRANVLGQLAPQVVTEFERGSGWHHIHSSWLGDVWIYNTEPGADPLKYVPPSKSTTETVKAPWTFFQFDPSSVGSRGEPFAPSITVENIGSTNSNGLFEFHNPVSLNFMLLMQAIRL